jgi:uncharacterized membrane protein YkvA (DUF1232 family)
VAKLWARQAHAAQVEAYALYFAMRDPQAPWFAKLVAAAAVGYVFSPIQLIPDWIPVIGCADDLAALGIALACMRWLTPQSVILACHERAEEAIAQRTWLARRRALVVVATIVLVALWLLIGTIGAIAIIRALSGGR